MGKKELMQGGVMIKENAKDIIIKNKELEYIWFKENIKAVNYG